MQATRLYASSLELERIDAQNNLSRELEVESERRLGTERVERRQHEGLTSLIANLSLAVRRPVTSTLTQYPGQSSHFSPVSYFSAWVTKTE